MLWANLHYTGVVSKTDGVRLWARLQCKNGDADWSWQYMQYELWSLSTVHLHLGYKTTVQSSLYRNIGEDFWRTAPSKTILAKSGWSGQIHSSQRLLRLASVLSTVVHPHGLMESARLHLLSMSPIPLSAHIGKAWAQGKSYPNTEKIAIGHTRTFKLCTMVRLKVLTRNWVYLVLRLINTKYELLSVVEKCLHWRISHVFTESTSLHYQNKS